MNTYKRWILQAIEKNALRCGCRGPRWTHWMYLFSSWPLHMDQWYRWKAACTRGAITLPIAVSSPQRLPWPSCSMPNLLPQDREAFMLPMVIFTGTYLKYFTTLVTKTNVCKLFCLCKCHFSFFKSENASFTSHWKQPEIFASKLLIFQWLHWVDICRQQPKGRVFHSSVFIICYISFSFRNHKYSTLFKVQGYFWCFPCSQIHSYILR